MLWAFETNDPEAEQTLVGGEPLVLDITRVTPEYRRRLQHLDKLPEGALLAEGVVRKVNDPSPLAIVGFRFSDSGGDRVVRVAHNPTSDTWDTRHDRSLFTQLESWGARYHLGQLHVETTSAQTGLELAHLGYMPDDRMMFTHGWMSNARAAIGLALAEGDMMASFLNSRGHVANFGRTVAQSLTQLAPDLARARVIYDAERGVFEVVGDRIEKSVLEGRLRHLDPTVVGGMRGVIEDDGTYRTWITAPLDAPAEGRELLIGMAMIGSAPWVAVKQLDVVVSADFDIPDDWRI